MIMCQCRFTFVWDIDAGGSCACAGAGGRWENAIPFAQYCCESKTALRNKAYIKKAEFYQGT